MPHGHKVTIIKWFCFQNKKVEVDFKQALHIYLFNIFIQELKLLTEGYEIGKKFSFKLKYIIHTFYLQNKNFY